MGVIKPKAGTFARLCFGALSVHAMALATASDFEDKINYQLPI